MKIGYARCSTDEQNLNLQRDALDAARCDQIFEDAGCSAVAKIRPGFEAALDALKPGDTLIIWKLDRAFRSTVDAILTLEALRQRDVEFQCLTMQIDTSTPEGRKWYRDTASWAEYERELISQRTKAGMAAARRRGIHLGRPRKLTDSQIQEAKRRLEGRDESCRSIADSYGVHEATLRRYLSEVARNKQT